MVRFSLLADKTSCIILDALKNVKRGAIDTREDRISIINARHNEAANKFDSCFSGEIFSNQTDAAKVIVRADDRQVSLLALLDLSAAFDAIDHSILLRRLEVTFGLGGTVLKWFTSYILGRYQSVAIDGKFSAPSPLNCGVPQRSVLGPVLFSIYSQPLSSVIEAHKCDFHKYADDTELSKSAPPDKFQTEARCSNVHP